jgi:hypothetical protein
MQCCSVGTGYAVECVGVNGVVARGTCDGVQTLSERRLLSPTSP